MGNSLSAETRMYRPLSSWESSIGSFHQGVPFVRIYRFHIMKSTQSCSYWNIYFWVDRTIRPIWQVRASRLHAESFSPRLRPFGRHGFSEESIDGTERLQWLHHPAISQQVCHRFFYAHRLFSSCNIRTVE